jgi:hypothetical protein
MSSAELLRKAADALDDGQIPLMNPFLADNGVTADQCFSLAEQLAIGARIVAAGIDDPRSTQGLAMILTMAETPLWSRRSSPTTTWSTRRTGSSRTRQSSSASESAGKRSGTSWT